MVHHTSTHFLLGSRANNLQYSAFKLAILTGQLGLLCFVVNVGYVVFDIFHNIYHSWPLLSLSALLSLVSFALNRQGYYLVAKIVLGLTTNLTIFFFAATEPSESGISFLFVVCALGAFTTLGLDHKRLAIVFVSLPAFLFLISIVFDSPFFVRTVVTQEYIRLNMIINFIATFVSAVLMIYFLLSINLYSENALRENEKRLSEKNLELVKTNKELDRFVYSASHDLRSPINSVRGLISLMQLDPRSPDTKTYLTMMDNQLIGLNRFIEDIVVYSRNARLGVKKDEIDLRGLIDDVLTSLQFSPGASEISIEVNIPEGITIYNDATRLRVVLANLLSNALKYSDLSKKNPVVAVSAVHAQSHVEIYVKDNGKGIAADFLPKIFDMFFQVNEKAEGSGLGLYIVKETLERIQGEIFVESELGIGSEFRVKLPVKIEAHDSKFKT